MKFIYSIISEETESYIVDADSVEDARSKAEDIDFNPTATHEVRTRRTEVRPAREVTPASLMDQPETASIN
jgi:hypothetical protein